MTPQNKTHSNLSTPASPPHQPCAIIMKLFTRPIYLISLLLTIILLTSDPTSSVLVNAQEDSSSTIDDSATSAAQVDTNNNEDSSEPEDSSSASSSSSTVEADVADEDEAVEVETSDAAEAVEKAGGMKIVKDNAKLIGAAFVGAGGAAFLARVRTEDFSY